MSLVVTKRFWLVTNTTQLSKFWQLRTFKIYRAMYRTLIFFVCHYLMPTHPLTQQYMRSVSYMEHEDLLDFSVKEGRMGILTLRIVNDS